MGYIYKISNDINNKIYIGQTYRPLKMRKREYVVKYNNPNIIGTDRDVPIYRAMRKYGIENFHMEIIEEVPQELLDEREIFWIDFYNSYKKGYNATTGGKGGPKGQTHPEVVNLWKNGYTMKQIKEKLSLNIETVKLALTKEGITREEILEHSYRNRPKYNSVFIDQLDKTSLEVVNSFISISEAARKTGFDRRRIGEASKNNKEYCGYKWRRRERNA